jgi:2-polyprenyl-6-hydroxyphenyl methylase/3-demethylubiquinone-9 3-methyltransferase
LDSLEGLRILDVGCGGGLISEPLARLGARVTGIDGALANIETAQAHALSQGLSVDYRHASPEDLLAKGEVFDVVLGLEVIEHTASPEAFMDACAQLTAPEGKLILSTLNQTIASYVLGIVAAEHLLGWVPKGTHQWRKFIRPRVLQRMLFDRGFEQQSFKGMHFSLSQRKWALGDDLSVNYFVCAQRQKTGKNGSKHFLGELSSWG